MYVLDRFFQVVEQIVQQNSLVVSPAERRLVQRSVACAVDEVAKQLSLMKV